MLWPKVLTARRLVGHSWVLSPEASGSNWRVGLAVVHGADSISMVENVQ